MKIKSIFFMLPILVLFGCSSQQWDTKNTYQKNQLVTMESISRRHITIELKNITADTNNIPFIDFQGRDPSFSLENSSIFTGHVLIMMGIVDKQGNKSYSSIAGFYPTDDGNSYQNIVHNAQKAGSKTIEFYDSPSSDTFVANITSQQQALINFIFDNWLNSNSPISKDYAESLMTTVSKNIGLEVKLNSSSRLPSDFIEKLIAVNDSNTPIDFATDEIKRLMIVRQQMQDEYIRLYPGGYKPPPYHEPGPPGARTPGDGRDGDLSAAHDRNGNTMPKNVPPQNKGNIKIPDWAPKPGSVGDDGKGGGYDICIQDVCS